MATRFHAISTFDLSSRQNFVIIGEVREGTVRPGMHVPLPPNAPPGCSGRIVGVESVDNLRERRFYTGLRIRYQSPEELAFWQALPLQGTELELREAVPPAA